MKSNHRQGSRSGTMAIALAVLAAVVICLRLRQSMAVRSFPQLAITRILSQRQQNHSVGLDLWAC